MDATGGMDAGRTVLGNREVVREFYDLAFQQRRPNDAAARCVAASPTSFTQPRSLASPQAYVAAVVGWIDTMPRLKVEVVRLVCEGEYVVVQSNLVPAPGLQAMLVMDLFRLRDGKIVEHWDALQQVREPSSRLPFE